MESRMHAVFSKKSLPWTDSFVRHGFASWRLGGSLFPISHETEPEIRSWNWGASPPTGAANPSTGGYTP